MNSNHFLTCNQFKIGQFSCKIAIKYKFKLSNLVKKIIFIKDILVGFGGGEFEILFCENLLTEGKRRVENPKIH